MSILALELNDRALATARDGQVLSVHTPAASSSLSARRTVDVSGTDLQRRISNALQAVEDSGSPWRIAATAGFDAGHLAGVLRLTRQLAIQVECFVDAATVSAAVLGLKRAALVLELGLHHVAATAVDSEAGLARRRRSLVSERGGLRELHDAWLDLISAAMVKRTRFDPLHDAAHERQLLDALPALLRDAAMTGSAIALVRASNRRFETPLTRDQFAQAAEPIYREILRLVHELRPAGAAVAVLAPSALTQLPGMREALDHLNNCELYQLADGFAAAAASRLEIPGRDSEDSVRLLRRLPAHADLSLATMVAQEPLGAGSEAAARASHVLFEGRAFALTEATLVVGRSPQSQNAIVLPEGLAGVSRRHCSFVGEGDDVVLVDHSRYGTFVNGERVAERVRVRAGDQVRIGEPGVELALIAVS